MKFGYKSRNAKFQIRKSMLLYEQISARSGFVGVGELGWAILTFNIHKCILTIRFNRQTIRGRMQ